jgi:hypothetical protein
MNFHAHGIYRVQVPRLNRIRKTKVEYTYISKIKQTMIANMDSYQVEVEFPSLFPTFE